MASHEIPPHEPYIPADTHLAELTLRAVVLGTLLGMVFGASSLYLVLKVGLTVSASIPVAVISITLFRVASTLAGWAEKHWKFLGSLPSPLAWLWRQVRVDATILENNIVQTAGSAGESIAFGVGVTMPAIMILGFDLEVTRVLLVAVLGGLLGILMMIPLRRALIVQQHGILKYPEGTACAEVLKAGVDPVSKAAASESAQAEHAAAEAAGLAGGSNARTIFAGFTIGLVYKTAMNALKGWKDTPGIVFGKPLEGGSLSGEISPELLGVGYIIGPRIAAVMCAGGVLAYLVLIPLIKFFGSGIPGVLAPGTIPISQMDPGQIRSAYVLYIGAGAVAAGGIISLLRSMPLIWHGLRQGLRDIAGGARNTATLLRIDRDLPMSFVGAGILALVIAIVAAPPLHMNLLGAILIVVFGFLFVTVSSRLTGEIGSSSNPISGMTVATLLLTCLVFLVVGWTGGTSYVTALSVGAIVCIAASNGGTTSQDLKTGYLVGATPRLQQVAILVGALASACVLGPILLVLNDSATVYVPVHSEVTVPTGELGPAEPLHGAQFRTDSKSYRVWHKLDDAGLGHGRYLVDAAGKPAYLVDPGINGTHDKRPDGSTVRKFDAPKATLMSYIIKGILDRQLPWGLVLFGVMIALVLELSGIPSLAFAVGVYLPLASSTPILVGGAIRWLVDRRQRQQLAGAHLTEAQLVAESDKSPGVLMASGYIAGGAIAGIVIAFLAGFLDQVDNALTLWAEANNPFFQGPSSDALAMVPFVIIAIVLHLVGSGRILNGGSAGPNGRPAAGSTRG
jgi:putative OPT family oligopeptide transporter